MRINVRSEGLIQSELATLSHCPTAFHYSGGDRTGASPPELCKCQKMKHCLHANPKHDTNCAAHSVLGVFVTLFSTKT